MKTVNPFNHILIVVPEEHHAEIIRPSFESHSDMFNVKFAASLKEANNYLLEKTPDLIITNLTFPDGNWKDLYALADNHINCLLLLMTGLDDEPMAIEAMPSGALDFIIKSDIALANMAQTAESILGGHLNRIRLKDAEEALKESEQRYRLLYERAPVGYQSLDKTVGVSIKTVMFIIRDAPYMTGSILNLDGGYVLGGDAVAPMPPWVL